MPAGDRRVIVDAGALAQTAARRIADVIERAVKRHGRATVALAGGNTPRAVYRQLAQLRLPWDKLEIFFGDERAVPPADAHSNYRMARESLLDTVPVPASRIHRMPAERPDREAAAAEYSAQIPDRFDLLILGLGEDGHTASLFPGSPALNEPVRRVVAVVGPKPPPHRLTVTPPVIAAAHEMIVLVSGSGKAAAVARALEGPMRPGECPAQLARDGIWILDRDAAAGLRQQASSDGRR